MTEQQLQERRKGIGGSDISAILGLSKYSSPYDVWRQKVLDERIEENEFMTAGKYLEQGIADRFADATGFEVVKPDFEMAWSKEYPIFFGSADRIVISDKGKSILEIKSTQLWIEEMMPEWVVQSQYYAGLLKYNNCFNAWLIRGFKFDYRELEADKEIFEMCIAKGTEFWNNYVIPKIEPPPINSQDIINLYYGKLNGKSITATPEIQKYITELKIIMAQKKDYKEKEETKKEQLKMIMQDAEYLLDSVGKELITWKANEGGSRVFKIK